MSAMRLNKALLPKSSGKMRGILCKAMLPDLPPQKTARLNKALLPEPLGWEDISKATRTHKYIRKYRKSGRWVYVYDVGGREVHSHKAGLDKRVSSGDSGGSKEEIRLIAARKKVPNEGQKQESTKREKNEPGRKEAGAVGKGKGAVQRGRRSGSSTSSGGDGRGQSVHGGPGDRARRFNKSELSTADGALEARKILREAQEVSKQHGINLTAPQTADAVAPAQALLRATQELPSILRELLSHEPQDVDIYTQQGADEQRRHLQHLQANGQITALELSTQLAFSAMMESYAQDAHAFAVGGKRIGISGYHKEQIDASVLQHELGHIIEKRLPGNSSTRRACVDRGVDDGRKFTDYLSNWESFRGERREAAYDLLRDLDGFASHADPRERYYALLSQDDPSSFTRFGQHVKVSPAINEHRYLVSSVCLYLAQRAKSQKNASSELSLLVDELEDEVFAHRFQHDDEFMEQAARALLPSQKKD